MITLYKIFMMHFKKIVFLLCNEIIFYTQTVMIFNYTTMWRSHASISIWSIFFKVSFYSLWILSADININLNCIDTIIKEIFNLICFKNVNHMLTTKALFSMALWNRTTSWNFLTADKKNFYDLPSWNEWMKDKTKIAKKLRNMNGFNGSYKSTWNFNKHDIAHSSLYKIVGFAVAKFHISYTHLHLINIESKFVVISFFSDYIVELHFENRFSMLS